MEIRRLVRRLVLAAFTVALAFVPATASSQPVVPAPEWTVLQLNFCGQADNPRCRVRGDDSGPAVEALVELMLATRPHLVMLQEICRTQFDAVQRRAAARGLALNAVWTTVWNDPRFSDCRLDAGGDQAQGDAMLTVSPVTDIARTCLERCTVSTVVEERRVLTCATTTLDRPVRACVVHIGPNDLEERVSRIAEVVDESARTMPVFLVGDLNTAQYSAPLDHLYATGSPTSRGLFVEADTCARRRGTMPTCNVGTLQAPGANVKLDYVFVTARDVVEIDGVTTHMEWSDHDAVVARVVFRDLSAAD